MFERTIPLACALTPQVLSSLLKDAACASPLFFDIETTGFSRSRCQVYLIGAVSYDQNRGWQLRQWLAGPQEEAALLQAFFTYARAFDRILSYNGDAFDLPFLKERAALYGLCLPELPSADLYKSLKPLSAFLKLGSMKQPMVEALLGYTDRIWPDGGDCIKIYRKYQKSSAEDEAQLLPLLGHNEEDLKGLLQIPSLLTFHSLREGRISALSAEKEGTTLLLTFRLEEAVPFSHSFGKEDFYLTVRENTGKLLLRGVTDRLKLYYENIKDYYYIPSEDTALPKSLCSGLGRDQRKAATRDTCYTWFSLNTAFFENPDRQTRYLQSLLRYYLF